MKKEGPAQTPAIDIAEAEDADSSHEGTEDSSEFDLDAFFAEDADDQPETTDVFPNLLLTLHNDSDETIATLTKKVTAETFTKGVALTTSVFSALGSVVGSCGLFCAHGLGSMVQGGTSGLSGTGLGSNLASGFSVDSHGNYHLSGNLDSLSRSTGISKHNLLSGNYSAEDILTAFFSSFGGGISMMFGFGIVDGIIGRLFDMFDSTPAVVT